GRSQPSLRVMDMSAMWAILPHRYPFLLIDRVVELESGQRVVAIKNVSINEPFFQGHWPDRPLMPGVLILEALAQAGGMLVAHWFDAENARAVIAGMDEVKLRRPVVPGDQMHLEVTTLRSRSRLVDVQARALVEGEVAAEAQLRFVLVPK